MSRLPKRKLELEDLIEQDEPRKLPALRSNFTSNIRTLPPLTKPAAPSFTSGSTKPARSTRGTSAPPQSTANVPPRRVAASSSNSTSRRPTSSNKPPASLPALQLQIQSMEEARKADAARLATEMALEREKFMTLEKNQAALCDELSKSRETHIAHRRELGAFEDEMREATRRFEGEKLELEIAIQRKEREGREALEDLRLARQDLDRERSVVSTLKGTLATQAGTIIELQSRVTTIQTQRDALQATLDGSGRDVSTLRLQLHDAHAELEKLRREAYTHEALRRKLHNTIQELKGNIRVFCRVRPVLGSDGTDECKPEPAAITYPDGADGDECKQITVSSTSESAMGKERKEKYDFSFDKVFTPSTTQDAIFSEVASLTQSCLDGYNVCIFAYGQTGSGKSYTMEGSSATSSRPTDTGFTSALAQLGPHAGLIPRAIAHIFDATHEMEKQGWTWIVEGWFLEIYNETINDLLSPSTTAKHDIHHHRSTHTSLPSTTVSNATIIKLTSPAQVAQLLEKGRQKRKIGKTRLNDRSSRGHAVFGIRVRGERARSGDSAGEEPERLEGTLNLVDLAGCERINVSFFSGPGTSASATSGTSDSTDTVGVLDPERLKETQSINKSLSALGDVISALGERGGHGGVANGHIPYRNSKLTYLLQNSLGGGAKVLMVLNLSPLATHIGESLNSLRFATKVNNTVVGGGGKKAAGKA